jgi:hypothetical protein
MDDYDLVWAKHWGSFESTGIAFGGTCEYIGIRTTLTPEQSEQWTFIHIRFICFLIEVILITKYMNKKNISLDALFSQEHNQRIRWIKAPKQSGQSWFDNTWN